MRYTDVRHVAGQPEDVWQALHDSEVLRAGFPGCERLIPLGIGEYAAILATREDICRGLLTVADRSPGAELTVMLAVRGRCSIFEVELDVRLHDGPAPGTTSLAYDARVHSGGAGSTVGPFFRDLGASMSGAMPGGPALT